MNETIKRTRQIYGSTQFVVNALLPNPFDSLPIEDAIHTIGEKWLAELKARAEARNWTPNRLKAEIRCLAEEIQARE